MPADASTDTPGADGAATREYIHVRPTDDPLAPGTVARQLERLHGLTVECDDGSGLLGTLTGPTEDPVRLEVLLVAPGGTATQLDYYLGCSHPERLDTVARIIAQLLPSGYELTRTDLSLPERVGPDAAPAHALQLYGRAERRDDWQTRLTTYAESTPTQQFRIDTPGLTAMYPVKWLRTRLDEETRTEAD
jgi:hypothetical protein